MVIFLVRREDTLSTFLLVVFKVVFSSSREILEMAHLSDDRAFARLWESYSLRLWLFVGMSVSFGRFKGRDNVLIKFVPNSAPFRYRWSISL